MSQVLAYNITDLTISFFAAGRMYAVQSDHPSFFTIRQQLSLRELEAEPLIELADIKAGLMKADHAQLLQFIGDTLHYGDAALGGVWVDKLMAFRAEGLDFEPILKAIDSLLRNPTPDAIARFPIFAERNRFGFLPNGRVGAFKYVKEDFTDYYTGLLDNSPGKVVEIMREACDPDPNQTCSRGLHIGALEYVKQHNSSASRVVFVAFWPQDVVSVPVDYNGTKMRVCRYEVLEEVAADFLDEFLGQRTTLIVVEAPEIIAYRSGYIVGWDLYDADEYGASLEAMIATRASINSDRADFLNGFDAGWRSASTDDVFDDEPPASEEESFGDALEEGVEEDRANPSDEGNFGSNH